MSRHPVAESSSHAHSDEEDSFNARHWNGGSSKFEIDHFLAGQEKNLHSREDLKDVQREQLVDSDFFNAFPDDFDEDDMTSSSN